MRTNSSEPLLPAGRRKGVAAQRVLPPLPPFVPVWYLLALSAVGWGLELAYAIEAMYAAPIFLELGLPLRYVSLVYAFSPTAGIFVQPLVASASDACTSSLGRRRPFLIVFATIAIIGAASFTRVAALGLAHSATLALSVVAFACIDFGLDTLMLPARSLLVDAVPRSRQNRAHSIYGALQGSGAALGYIIGGLEVGKLLPFLGTNPEALFTVVAVLLALASLTTFFVSREGSDDDDDADDGNESVADADEPVLGLLDTMRAVMGMPRVMVRLMILTGAQWMGVLSFLFFVSDWCGEKVFNGDVHAPRHTRAYADYHDGVRYASLCFAGAALVTLVWSAVLPRVMRATSVQGTLAVSLLLFGGLSIGCHWIHTKWYAAVAISVGYGFSFAALSVIPYAVAGLVAEPHEAGLFTAVINVSLAISQLVVSFVGGPIMELTSVSFFLAVAGTVSSLGAFLAFTLVDKNGRPIRFRRPIPPPALIPNGVQA